LRDDQLGAEPVAQPLGRLARAAGAVLVEALAIEIADPRAEPPPEQVVGGEDHLGVAVRVGRVLLDLKRGVVVEDPVERVRSVAHVRADHPAVVLAVLVRGPRVVLDPAATVPEVAWQRPGLGTAGAGGEPEPVGGRQAPRADRAGERGRVVVVDQARVRGIQRRLAQIPVRGPVELVVAEPAAARHPGQPEVGRLRQDRGVQDTRQLGAAAGGGAGRGEMLGEPGPAVDQQVGQPDLGQPLGDELAELPGRVLVGGLLDDEFALVELCAGFRVERRVEPFDELGLLAGELVEAFGGLKRLANPCCELGADWPPLLFWQQVTGGVGVPAAALDPYPPALSAVRSSNAAHSS
jgi:hypothetical protein